MKNFKWAKDFPLLKGSFFSLSPARSAHSQEHRLVLSSSLAVHQVGPLKDSTRARDFPFNNFPKLNFEQNYSPNRAAAVEDVAVEPCRSVLGRLEALLAQVLAEVPVGRALRQDAPRVVLGAQPQDAGHVRVAEGGEGGHRLGELLSAKDEPECELHIAQNQLTGNYSTQKFRKERDGCRIGV